MIIIEIHLNYVVGKDRVVPGKGPGYLGVDETVSYDESKKSPQLCRWHRPGSAGEGTWLSRCG